VRRREFITFLGGAAVAWPLSSCAEQSARVRRIGVLHGRALSELKYVLEKFETEPMPVQVIYPQARLMSRKVRTFVDECVGKLRGTTFD